MENQVLVVGIDISTFIYIINFKGMPLQISQDPWRTLKKKKL